MKSIGTNKNTSVLFGNKNIGTNEKSGFYCVTHNNQQQKHSLYCRKHRSQQKNIGFILNSIGTNEKAWALL